MDNVRWAECTFVLAIFIVAAATRNVSLSSVAVEGYRAFIQSMIWAEGISKMGMGEPKQKDGCVITYFKGERNLGRFTGHEEGIPTSFTHAEVKWTLNNCQGTSLFRNDSPVLSRLQSTKDIGAVLELSKFQLLSLTGTKADGTVVEIHSLPSFLKGDIVYDALWKQHFKEYNDFIYIDAIDHNINILHVGEGGIVIAESNAEPRSKDNTC